MQHDLFYSMQLQHHQHIFPKKEFPIVILCEAIRTPENIGMLFRVAEAFGVQKLFLHQHSPKAEDKLVKRISRHTIEKVDHQIYEEPIQHVQEYKRQGYKVLALEITSTSKPISEIKLQPSDKLFVIVGAERTGVGNNLLGLCDQSVHIQMYGSNSSMNVVNSVSVALYEFTKQLSV